MFERRMGHHFTGVILAAGEGRRMGGLGAVWAKACLPVCNRPLVHHHLDLLHEMGVREVVDSVERKRLWDIAVAAFPPYQEYQDKTDRVIPVFIAEAI